MKSLFAGTALGLLTVPNLIAHAQDADAIYFGGPILTVNDNQPFVEAVAVADGMIVAVGGVTVYQHGDG